MSSSLDNFAPRVGAIYRLNDKTVFRTGYGLTFNATPWARAVRGDNDYPITIASKWFDTSAFAQPTGVRFGNTGRNQFYGPGGWTLDFSLFRSFPMGGTRRLEYRLQAANLLNHPVFGTPSASITSGTLGQITGISGNGSYLERQIQMGFRFSF